MAALRQATLLVRATRSRHHYHNVVNVARTASTAAVPVDLSGVFPPIATPFDNNDCIDYDKLAFNLQRWNEIPFKGSISVFLSAGSAQNFLYLNILTRESG